MKTCHVCLYQCEDEKELCPVCGAELRETVTEEPEEKIDEALIKDPVLAASVGDVVTAEIYRDILTENKIPFTCDSGENSAGMKVLFGGGFVTEDIYVDSSNLEVAQQLYEEVLASEADFEAGFDEEFTEE